MTTEQFEQRFNRSPINTWFPPSSWELVEMIRNGAKQHTKWLGTTCKYINVRIDMRTGHFNFSDQYGNAVDNETLIKLIS